MLLTYLLVGIRQWGAVGQVYRSPCTGYVGHDNFGSYGDFHSNYRHSSGRNCGPVAGTGVEFHNGVWHLEGIDGVWMAFRLRCISRFWATSFSTIVWVFASNLLLTTFSHSTVYSLSGSLSAGGKSGPVVVYAMREEVCGCAATAGVGGNGAGCGTRPARRCPTSSIIGFLGSGGCATATLAAGGTG